MTRISARLRGPTPQQDYALSKAFLREVTDTRYNSKLLLKRKFGLAFLLVQGHPWVYIPKVSYNSGAVTFCWLLWMGFFGKDPRNAAR